MATHIVELSLVLLEPAASQIPGCSTGIPFSSSFTQQPSAFCSNTSLLQSKHLEKNLYLEFFKAKFGGFDALCVSF